MWLPSLPGLVSASPRWSTIGSGGWLVKIIVLLSSYSVGPSTGRAPVEAPRPQMSFLTLLSTGLETPIHESERRGRRGKDWQSSSRIVERYLFWTVWSRSKIHLVHKKDAYVSLPSRRFCANSLPSTRGFVLLPRGCRSLILQITSKPRPCVVAWNNYPTMPARNCCGRWALRDMRRSCETPVTSSVAIVLL